MNKLRKRILIALLILTLITPIGVFLPAFVDAGDAWGEWSAETVKEFIGYVPAGLAKYSDTWKAPIDGYTLNGEDASIMHQSGYYIISGIIGAILTLGVTLLISKFIVKNAK
jgi:predicted PurR-regulated permease PerM